MTEYRCEFGFYREDGEPIDQDVIDKLTDSWVEAIEAHDLYTGGGITEYTDGEFIVERIRLELLWLRNMWRSFGRLGVRKTLEIAYDRFVGWPADDDIHWVKSEA